jgi:hypothetical protein
VDFFPIFIRGLFLKPFIVESVVLCFFVVFHTSPLPMWLLHYITLSIFGELKIVHTPGQNHLEM